MDNIQIVEDRWGEPILTEVDTLYRHPSGKYSWVTAGYTSYRKEKDMQGSAEGYKD